MWSPLTLATVLASLLVGISSSSLHPSTLLDPFADDLSQTMPWRDYPGDDLMGGWTDKDTLAQQLFGDKSTDSLSGEDESDLHQALAKREGGHSLSIVNPLDVLRQRLMLEMARRRMSKNQDQIRENEVILKTLGRKRSPQDNRTKRDYRRIHVSNSDEFDV